MQPNAIDNRQRVQALKALRAQNAPLSENPFAQIVETVSELFDMPNVAIHLLDDESQWVKALVGDKFECSVENSFCQHALTRNDDVWVIPKTREHDLFYDHPLTLEGRIGFYAVATLNTSEGFRIGTLCLTDPEPREDFRPEQRRLLRQFADIIVAAMELRKDFHEVQRALTNLTEVDGLTALPNTASFLKWALTLADHASIESRIGLVRVHLIETDIVQQSAGETGLNELHYRLARRLDRNIAEDEFLLRASDGDLVFARHFENGGSEEGSKRIEAWAKRRCETADHAVSIPFKVQDRNHYVKTSFGLAAVKTQDANPIAALDASKIACERARTTLTREGVWFSAEFSNDARGHAVAEDELREAVREKKFRLAFQPVVSIADGNPEACGAEALLRWPNQREPVLGPAEFIPMAEQKGLIGEIGLWVFEQACETLARWGGSRPLWLSVNVSPQQLNDQKLPEKFAAIASRTGVPPGQIKLEITESALTGNFTAVRDMLIQLRETGFPLVLDDFGTGHSSLARLIHLPFDGIKVDRAFVSDLPDGPGAAVVAALRNLTRELGMEAIAEGVETVEQQEFLVEEGYRFAQGYHYARPMFGDEFDAWFESREVVQSAPLRKISRR